MAYDRSTLTYPLSAENGRLTLSKSAQIERDQIFSVLETLPGERIMRPFKTGHDPQLHKLLANAAVIPARIEVALMEQVPGLQWVRCTGSLNEQGQQFVRIYWASVDGERGFEDVAIAP